MCALIKMYTVINESQFVQRISKMGFQKCSQTTPRCWEQFNYFVLPLGLKSLQSLMSNSTKYNKISILYKFNYTVLIVLSKFIK